MALSSERDLKMIDMDLKNKLLKIFPESVALGTAFNKHNEGCAFMRIEVGIESPICETIDVFIPYDCIERVYEDLKRAKEDIDAGTKTSGTKIH